MPSADTKLEVLHEHYKDSFTHLLEYKRQRDWFFILILLVIGLMLFQVYSPRDAGDAISQFITARLDLDKPIDISFVGSIIWFSLLTLVVRYFQAVITIDRQYKYMHQLEAQLCRHYEDAVFTREGQFYLCDYPMFLNWASALYTIIFPVLLLIVALCKVIHDLATAKIVSLTLITNILVFVGIVVSTFLYLRCVHFGK